MTISKICTAAVAFSVLFLGAVTAEAAPVKGNPKSKIYHIETCKYYNGKGSTQVFNSSEEAVKAGFTPCKVCGKTTSNKKNVTAAANTGAQPKFVVNVESKTVHKADCKVINIKDQKYKPANSVEETLPYGYKPCQVCLGTK